MNQLAAGFGSAGRNNFRYSHKKNSLRFLAEFSLCTLAVAGIVILCLASHMAYAESIQVSFPFTLSADTIFSGEVGSAVPLRLTITPNIPCDEIALEVVEADHLTFTGPASMKAAAAQGKPTEFTLMVVIPPHDTSGFVFDIRGGGFGQTAKTYWVTVGDSVVSFPGNPRLSPTPVEGRDPMGVMPAKSRPEKRVTLGYFDTAGNPISEEDARRNAGTETDRPPASPPLKSPARRMSDAEKMRALEQEPLTTADQQVFVLDSQVWCRDRGETKFHRAEPFTREELHRRTDSIQAHAMVTDFDVTLDLRDTTLYKTAQSMVGKLTPMDTPGYYRTIASGALLKQLRGKGIYDAPYPQLPRDRTAPKKCGETALPTQPEKPNPNRE